MISLSAQDPADPLPALHCRGFSAGGDRRGLQESRDHMVVAVFTDHFLRQVRLADFNILSVSRGGHIQGISAPFHIKVQVLQNPEYVFRGNRNTEDRVDPLQARSEMLSFPRCAGAAVKGAGCDLTAAQFLNQVQGTGHAQFGGVFADAFLEAGGRVAALSQSPGGFPDIVPGKLGRLKQQLCRMLGDFAVQAAHDARQGYGAVAVADHQVIGGQGEFLFVQRLDLFPVLRPAHDDLPLLKLIHVKGMHRLADLQQHIVGDIHNVGNAAQAAQGQVPFHPPGALADGDVPHPVSQIAGAQVRRFHRNVQIRILVIGNGIIGRRHLQLLAEGRRDFPGNTQNALTIRPVRSDGDVENRIVQADHIPDVIPGRRILRQVQQTVYLGAWIQVFVQAQFLPGAQHAV